MSFSVDFIDDDDDQFGQDILPPSTPDPPRRPQAYGLSPQVSTTPAGPPPSSLTGLSTTPAAPPPRSSLFGSAHLPPPSFSSNNHSFSRNLPSSPPPQVQSADIRNDSDYDFDDSAMDEDEPLDDIFAHPRQSPFRGARPSTLSSTDVAQSLTLGPPGLHEKDVCIINTEEALNKLWTAVGTAEVDPVELDNAIGSTVQELLVTWQKQMEKTQHVEILHDGATASRFDKAAVVAGLLLPIRHCPQARGAWAARSRMSIPKLLLDWLNNHDWPLRSGLGEVAAHLPNCAAHNAYWDVLFSAALHGDLTSVIRFLREADWSKAATAVIDEPDTHVYSAMQVHRLTEAVRECIVALEKAPSLQHGDFNIADGSWAVFRKIMAQTITDLEVFAEGESANRHSQQSSRPLAGSISFQSRKVQSSLPWTPYQNMHTLLKLLSGSQTDIAAAATNWLEAALCMTVWWDGEDDPIDQEAIQHSLASSHRLLTRSGSQRLLDVSPQEAYLKKLASTASTFWTDPEDYGVAQHVVSTVDPIEMAFYCALTGDVEGVLSLLSGWSTVVAKAVIEVADCGSWLGLGLMDKFDQSDLMVLSYGGPQTRQNRRDAAIIEFAQLVEKHPPFKLDGTKMARVMVHVVEGWQLSIETMARLRDRPAALKRVSDLLGRKQITDIFQVEQTVELCNRIGLHEEATNLLIGYGDFMANDKRRYGEAIFYYVRGHASERIRDLLKTLTMLSLTHSAQFPARDDSDSTIRSLVQSPRQTVAHFRTMDPFSAETLMTHTSGYATLSKFYEIRDAPVTKDNPPPQMRAQAAPILTALIESASDGIHGGLYDDSVESAVPVDALLLLLGETLPLMGGEHPVFSAEQLFVILKAAEDLDTVSVRIRGRVEEAFHKAASAANGTVSASQSITLGSGVLDGSSAFSMIGSELLRSGSRASQTTNGNGDSGVLVPKPFPVRGWDWRAGLRSGVSAADLLEVVRLQASKELAACWTVTPGAE